MQMIIGLLIMVVFFLIIIIGAMVAGVRDRIEDDKKWAWEEYQAKTANDFTITMYRCTACGGIEPFKVERCPNCNHLMEGEYEQIH